MARALHEASARRAGPFVPVHCGAIPGELLESELFGHLKGSFTGAYQDRPGLLAAADSGTLFFDEAGEMPPAMQVKLLRFLQEGTYTPVGGREPRKADVRVISATNRDLEALVATGGFREDLFYRLKGMVLRTLPLAERQEDIAPMAMRFLDEAWPSLRFSPDGLAWLAGQNWPGNVRELKAVVDCAAALAGPANNGVIGPEELAFARYGDAEAPDVEGRGRLAEAVAKLERRMIAVALAATNNNRSEAARELGLSRAGLLKMMSRLKMR